MSGKKRYASAKMLMKKRLCSFDHDHLLSKITLPEISVLHKEKGIRAKVMLCLCLEKQEILLPLDIINHIINYVDMNHKKETEEWDRILNLNGQIIYDHRDENIDYKISLIPRDIYTYTKFAYKQRHTKKYLLSKYHYMPSLCRYIKCISYSQVDPKAPCLLYAEDPAGVKGLRDNLTKIYNEVGDFGDGSGRWQCPFERMIKIQDEARKAYDMWDKGKNKGKIKEKTKN